MLRRPPRSTRTTTHLPCTAPFLAQAGVVGIIDTNRTQMSALVGHSQGATGALQATQAVNQLLALQAQQLADLTAVVAANGRAQNRSEAGRAAEVGSAHV